MSKIKRYFVTGLLVTLPVFLTVYFLFVVFKFIDGIWGKLINFYLKKHLGLAIPGLGFILGILTVLMVGFLATNFLGKKVFHAVERWFLRLPIIRQVYPAVKQIIDALISKDKPAFKKVVMVEFPSKGIWSVGFVTNDSFAKAQEKAGTELIHVLIGTTPSPFSGYFILVPKGEVKFLDISTEEAIKLSASGGIVKPR